MPTIGKKPSIGTPVAFARDAVKASAKPMTASVRANEPRNPDMVAFLITRRLRSVRARVVVLFHSARE
jgi:hypothetical protein